MINQNIRSISLRKKIMLLIMLITVTIVALTSITFYVQFKGILFNRVIEDQHSVIQQSKINIENIANGVNQATVYLYTDKSIARIVQDNSDNSVVIVNNIRDLHDIFTYYATTPLTSSISTYYAVLFINDNFKISGKLDSYALGTATQSLNGVYNSSSVENEDWYKKTVSLNGALYTFILQSNKNMIYVSRLIRNQNINDLQYGDVLGVVVVGLDIINFKDQIESSKLTPNTEVMLVNAEKTIIYSNDKTFLWSNIASAPLTSRININKSGSFDTTILQKKYLTSVFSLYWGWTLIIMIPYTDIYSSLSVVTYMTIFIAAIGIVCSTISSILLANSITKPINKLASIMHSINDESNIQIKAKYIKNDEIGILYNSFNGLMKRINTLLSYVYESNEKQRKAELKALQAQINPHFIYNTLDAVNWIALCHNENDIVSMVSSLAYILRYSIKNPDERVTVYDEITYIHKYISILSIRYGNKFNIQFDIDKDIMEALIPKFTIQPLVENCIVHGFTGIKKSGKIAISGFRNNNVIELFILDNGIGTDVTEINNYLEGKTNGLKESDGFGIMNINQRIKLNYGNTYGLTYMKNEGDGITAHIVIPLNPETSV